MTENISERICERFTDESRLQCWLDIEAALARSQAKMGIIPQIASDDINEKAKLENIDMARYFALYKEQKHPLTPLLQLLREAAGESGEYVHLGATTHDVVDIGKMTALKYTWETTEKVLLEIERDILDMAEKHAYTLMAGRSHNIQATPITFGFKAAIWASEVRRSIERLQRGKGLFVVTFCGATGTMTSFGGRGAELEALMAQEFELRIPDISWHAARDRFAEIACTFAIIGGTLGRIAQEVYLLMGSETAELSEGYGENVVGSSAMPHKINPINSQHIMGGARTLRYDAAHCIECMLIDHEHNLAHFDDERTTLERIGRTMGDILERSYELIHNLRINEKNMARNLNVLHGAVLSENVMLALGKKIGKMTAKEIITELAGRTGREETGLGEILKSDARVNSVLSGSEIDELLSPKLYAEGAAKLVMEFVTNAKGNSDIEMT